MDKPIQISVCMFKRKATKTKSEGWERGIAFIRDGDVDFIVDKDGEKLSREPHDWLTLANEGSFIAQLEVSK